MIRVLVAGGHTVVRESLLALLCAEGDMQCEAVTLADAMHLSQDAAPDVILVEHHADSEPLDQFLEAAGARGHAGKVLVITGWISDMKKQALLRAGAGGIFSAQRHARELAQAIRRVAGGKRWLEEGAVPATVRFASALSRQEQRAASLAVECLSNKEIAARMSVSESYVKGLLQRVFLKMGVHNRGGLIRTVIEGAQAQRPGLAAKPAR